MGTCVATTKGDVLLKVEVYTTNVVFDELKAEWNPLVFASRQNQIFLTWEWQSNWWAAYHPGHLWVLAIRADDGQLVGMAPWFKNNDNVVRFIGCEDVTDYLDIIAHPGYEAEVYETIGQFLTDNQADYSRLNLCNIPALSASLSTLPRILEDNGLDVLVEPVDVCPVIDLPSDFQEYLADLDKKQRHEIRRKMRRAAGVDIDWYIVGGGHDLDEETDKFLQLMGAANAEKSEFLEDLQHVDFFKRIIPATYEAGWLQLAIITYEGQPSAAYLNFDYNDEILVYNSGLDVNVGGQFSPGIVLLAHLINDAIEKGRARFDLLRGDEEYKYRIGGKDTEVKRLIIEKQGILAQ